MSESTKQAVLGLGDGNIDPDILTKEIDHDFFDNPSERVDDEAECFSACQPMEGDKLNFLSKMPNEGGVLMRASSEPDCSNSSSSIKAFMGLSKGDGFEDALTMDSMNGYHVDSGRSSSNTNTTVHLDLRKDGKDDATGSESEDFYSIQSNANYPRPKESYQLQQRRRSFGTIPQPQRNSTQSGKETQFQPMNPVDCGLNEPFGDVANTDSSSSSNEDADDESDSDLSDSSESELESLDTDDEEFVDMLEKYFDYIDPDSDCSDLTEVSPLSSLAPSPLPPSYFLGVDVNIGDTYHPQMTRSTGENNDYHNMNIVTEAQLIEATSNLQLCDKEESGSTKVERESKNENSRDLGLNSTAEIDVAVAAVTAVASAVPAAAQFLERDMIRGGKPKLPTVISTTETVIIPADEESDDDNNGPGSLCMSGAGTCGTSIDIADVDDVDYDPTAEENTGVFGERDPAKDKKELDVCFNCCVMEHAKKILSREASPSRRSNRWLTPKQDGEEGNGNNGGNDNNVDDMGRGLNGEGLKVRNTWKGKLRTGSSTSATSSSSSTTGSSSTNTFGSGLSGASGGSSGTSGGGLRRAQKNFTFTPEQMRKIERENHVLLRKILDTHQKGFHHGHHGVHCHHHKCKNNGHHHGHNHQSRAVSSSTSIARLRQQQRIEHENAILMKKLQTVKPSKEIGDAFATKPVKN